MRLATIRLGASGTAAAIIDADVARPVKAPDVGSALAAGLDPLSETTGEVLPLAEVDFAPVVPRPGTMLCLGHNYRSHVEEMGRPIPGHPTLFAKVSTALIAAHDEIQLPAVSEQVDWEAELGVVIGRTVGPGQAPRSDTIAGYTVVNDISVRDWQSRTPQWFQGKNFDRSTPVGPWLVTPDELTDPTQLDISCEVDGQLMQSACTSDLIFSPDDVVAYVASFMTLHPGDVLSLGTPGGVGAARTPPVFLRAGQVVRTVIDGVGELVNRCAPPVTVST